MEYTLILVVVFCAYSVKSDYQHFTLNVDVQLYGRNNTLCPQFTKNFTMSALNTSITYNVFKEILKTRVISEFGDKLQYGDPSYNSFNCLMDFNYRASSNPFNLARIDDFDIQGTLWNEVMVRVQGKPKALVNLHASLTCNTTSPCPNGNKFSLLFITHWVDQDKIDCPNLHYTFRMDLNTAWNHQDFNAYSDDELLKPKDSFCFVYDAVRWFITKEYYPNRFYDGTRYVKDLKPGDLVEYIFEDTMKAYLSANSTPNNAMQLSSCYLYKPCPDSYRANVFLLMSDIYGKKCAAIAGQNDIIPMNFDIRWTYEQFLKNIINFLNYLDVPFSCKGIFSYENQPIQGGAVLWEIAYMGDLDTDYRILSTNITLTSQAYTDISTSHIIQNTQPQNAKVRIRGQMQIDCNHLTQK